MPSSVSPTVYEPSADDPRIVAVLAAMSRLSDVMAAQDVPGIEALMADDMLVNAPINKVVNRDNVISRIKAGQISYEPDVVTNIELVGVRGALVVVMGEQVAHPNQGAPHAGKTVYRRFTDIWTQSAANWKLWIRQATITKVK